MAKVTMRMIARAAEVSPTTISHVLNETENTFIAIEMRRKVLATAARLGYTDVRETRLRNSVATGY